MEPSVQDYFPEFKGKNEEELRGLFSFETQSTLMINIFDEVVEKLDDMDSVINLLQKTAERHRQMGISAEVFRVRIILNYILLIYILNQVLSGKSVTVYIYLWLMNKSNSMDL